MCFIDLDFEAKKYHFKRYVDDYRFYFRTEDEAKKALKDIALILKKYKLSINESKIKLEKYPFDVKTNFTEVLYKSNKGEGADRIFNLISKANKLYKEGEEASFLYVLKMIQNETQFDMETWKYLESFFLFIISIRPDLSRIISQIILPNKHLITHEFIMRLHNLLNDNIEWCRESEVLWIFWLIISIDIFSVKEDLLLKLLDFNNNFVKIIVIDYIIENDKNSEKISVKLEEIKNKIEKMNINTGDWLILYEAAIKNWFKDDNIIDKIINSETKNGNKKEFFEKLFEEKVDFFEINYNDLK